MTTKKSNAAHLTASGKRRSVKSGTIVQVWEDDCQGRTSDARVLSDLCWGNLYVDMGGRQARVRWVDEYNAYRAM